LSNLARILTEAVGLLSAVSCPKFAQLSAKIWLMERNDLILFRSTVRGHCCIKDVNSILGFLR
jgi:hypothetical protein